MNGIILNAFHFRKSLTLSSTLAFFLQILSSCFLKPKFTNLFILLTDAKVEDSDEMKQFYEPLIVIQSFQYFFLFFSQGLFSPD